MGSDIQSKVLAFAFGLSAEIERDLISQRTKEALNRLKAEGKKLGRPKGSLNKDNPLMLRSEEIQQLLSQKISREKIAKIMGITRRTLYSFLKSSMCN